MVSHEVSKASAGSETKEFQVSSVSGSLKMMTTTAALKAARARAR
jgi:hypothetical protein